MQSMKPIFRNVLTAITMITVLGVQVGRAHAEETTGSDQASLTTSEDGLPYRSPGAAITMSVISTLVVTLPGLYLVGEAGGDFSWIGATVTISGSVLGPSVGHMYTGNWGKVAAFSGGRLACLGLGLLVAYGAADSETDELGDAIGNSMTIGLGFGLAAAGMLALSIWEAVETYHSAEEFNKAQRTDLKLSPLVFPPPSKLMPEALPGFGLGLSGRF